MSKAGVSVRSGNVEAVTEVKRKRKRVEIVKITVDGPDGHPVEVDAKECTKCGEVKALTEFNLCNRNSSGRQSYCKRCKHRYREINSERIAERSRNWYEENREKVISRNRQRYGEKRQEILKAQRDYYRLNREKKRRYRELKRHQRREQRRNWYQANRGHAIEYARRYRADNPDKIRQALRNWSKNNPETIRSIRHRRFAVKRELPECWDLSKSTDVLMVFNNSCALCGSSTIIHMDHFVSLSTGHCGSYKGNMVPLLGGFNISKHNKHPYEWFDANKDRLGISESAWNEMTATLAAQNGLTPSEFRAFVDWCYTNKRTVAQTKRDNERYGYKKPSLEIWREATGLQFPIRVDFGTSTQLSAIGERSTPDCGNSPEVTAS